MAGDQRGLLTEELAAAYTGRPGVTIRRWAHEGRITRHGSGRGNVRYSVAELEPKRVDPDTGKVTPGPTPPLPAAHP